MSTSQRKNISEPPEWWAAFQTQADAEGLSLSEWVGNACLDALPKRERNKLAERPAMGRPNTDSKAE